MIETYIKALPEERQAIMTALVACIRDALPHGFEERMNYGMPSWVVPHSLYAPGYHVDPALPLPFLSLASQKRHIGLYHMGLYASQPLMDWFVDAYTRHSTTKLNMGKSCIRFTNIKKIPVDLIEELCSKITPQAWIDVYEAQIRPAG